MLIYSPIWNKIMSMLSVLVKYGSSIIIHIGFVLVLIALIKDKSIKIINVVIIFIMIALLVLEVWFIINMLNKPDMHMWIYVEFAGTKIKQVYIKLFELCADMFVLLHWGILVIYMGKKQKITIFGSNG